MAAYENSQESRRKHARNSCRYRARHSTSGPCPDRNAVGYLTNRAVAAARPSKRIKQ